MSTLYGSDADAKAKAKALSGKSAITSNRGVESVLNGSSHTATSTLYGSDADAKAKAEAKASRGNSHKSSTSRFSSAAASVGTTANSTVDETLFGSDADAKAKARSALGGSQVAANPGVETVSLPAFVAERMMDGENNHTEEPVAKRIFIESTNSDSPSINSDLESKNSISLSADQLEVQVVESLQIIPNDPEVASSKRANKSKRRKREQAKKSKKKCITLIFMLLLLLIAAGVVAWLFLFKNSNISKGGNNKDSQIGSTNPTTAPSSSASSGGIGGTWANPPTTTPFFESLLYQPPSESHCDAIARNQTIAGRDAMEDADFGLGLDVVLSGDSTMTEQLVNQLLDAIQEKILPSLAGCSILVDDFVEAWRFVVFDAFVTGNVEPDERCMDESLATQNCHLMSIRMDLFLKGRVRFLDIIELITDEEENISNHLGLPDPFRIVKLNRQIDILTPTASPTIAPSDVPSSTPSETPTGQLSTNPSSLSTAAPTKKGSGVPTRSPSLTPSLAPSSLPKTPFPTVYQSLAPTPLPSESPSALPSETPSAAPSFLPSMAPSATPSMSPSASPSLRPTNVPSRTPTALPSGSPTGTPSAPPTTSPAPSSTPSFLPSVTSFYWVTCGARGGCAGNPATVQNANHKFIDGLRSTLRENMIGVRCCSDTQLPDFELRNTSCPYAGSRIDGNCYYRATYYKAENVCTSVGARLCTLDELENNCAASTGCQHNDRMAWTSTPGP